MFENSELSSRLNENHTQLTIIIPADKKNECTTDNFNKLAAFINAQVNCHTLQFLAAFQMTKSQWSAFGQALAGTQLHALVLVGNFLGKFDFSGERYITVLMSQLNSNPTLYSLDVHDTQMDRIAIDSLAPYVEARPAWLIVKASQATEKTPTCRLVDGAVKKNRNQLTKKLICIAQACKTQTEVNVSEDFRGLFRLPRDIVKKVVQLTFFAGDNHPFTEGITKSLFKAHQITNQPKSL